MADAVIVVDSDDAVDVIDDVSRETSEEDDTEVVVVKPPSDEITPVVVESAIDQAKDIGALTVTVAALAESVASLTQRVSEQQFSLDQLERAQAETIVKEEFEDLVEEAQIEEVNEDEQSETEEDVTEEENENEEIEDRSEPRSAQVHPLFRSLASWRTR